MIWPGPFHIRVWNGPGGVGYSGLLNQECLKFSGFSKNDCFDWAVLEMRESFRHFQEMVEIWRLSFPYLPESVKLGNTLPYYNSVHYLGSSNTIKVYAFAVLCLGRSNTIKDYIYVVLCLERSSTIKNHLYIVLCLGRSNTIKDCLCRLLFGEI